MDINKEILNEIERFEQCGTHLDVASFVSNLKEILGRATPEGFVLVPRKATKHQINKAIYDLNLSGGTDILVDIYKAMIEAQEQSHD